jgi:hypothetical protein
MKQAHKSDQRGLRSAGAWDTAGQLRFYGLWRFSPWRSEKKYLTTDNRQLTTDEK